MNHHGISRNIVFSLACGLSAAGCLAIASPASAQQVKAYHQWTAPFEYNGPATFFQRGRQNPKTIRVGILAEGTGRSVILEWHRPTGGRPSPAGQADYDGET